MANTRMSFSLPLPCDTAATMTHPPPLEEQSSLWRGLPGCSSSGISQGAGRRKKMAIEEKPGDSRRQAGPEEAIIAGGPMYLILLVRLLDGTPDPDWTPDRLMDTIAT